jgi:preprotein translocase subunit SecF
MEFLTNTNIPFLRYRNVVVWFSIALLVATAVEFLYLGGLNFGIDFAGGTQMTVKFRDAVGVDEIRAALGAAGQRDAQIQSLGEDGDNEVLIKTPVVEGSEEGSSKGLIQALSGAFNPGRSEAELDLNRRGGATISILLQERDPDGLMGADTDQGRLAYDAIANAVVAARDDVGLFAHWDQVRGVDGLTEAAAKTLEDATYLGAFQIRKNENVGPQVGSELRTRGVLAMACALFGMLMYMWYRFELRFGIGAVVAVFHDATITLGLYSLMDYEFNLPTIAAFLTLIGYSVNDTVVIFDRVRENMRRYRRKPLEEVMDLSINQTLSRTVLTSGTTLLVVVCLFLVGGDVLRGFSFVLLIGVLIGTYSSVFVASPFALLWEQVAGKKDRPRS